MKFKRTSKTLPYTLGAGLLLCAAQVVSADTLVTFQVDMGVVLTNGSGIFDPTNTVSVHGSFNGWGSFALTNNPNAAYTNLYTGTISVTGPVMDYKYTVDPGAKYESFQYNNRVLQTPGGSVTAPRAYFNDTTPDVVPTNPVQFQVNLAQQINIGAFDTNASTVYARGLFNSYSATFPLTNDPTILTTNQFGLVSSNVYVGTLDITGAPGATMGFKYYIDTGGNWESPGPANGDPDNSNNRFFNLVDGPLTLPIVYFSDAPFAPVVTNDVTFQVDMSAQLFSGGFDPAQDIVDVRGNFNSWSSGINICTNDPTANNTNLYTSVVRVVDGVGAVQQYKFVYAGANVPGGTDWESPGPNTPTLGGNRYIHLADTNSQILPPVFFSDLTLPDFVTTPTEVTFTVDMTGAIGTDSHVFDPTADSVFVNGDFLGWLSWNPIALASYQMTNIPATSNYSITLPIRGGNPLELVYKYSINGADNEAPANANHVRYIRTLGTHTLPTDHFGNQFQESSFGFLAAGSAFRGITPISWVGRPGVHLQMATSLARPVVWQDLTNTDGSVWSEANGHLSNNGFVTVTNFPTAPGRSYFRLIKPAN